MKNQIVKIAAIVAILFSGVVTALAQDDYLNCFNEQKYKSDASYLRAKSYGESPDLSMAQEIALANAQVVMSKQLEVMVNALTAEFNLQSKCSKCGVNQIKFENIIGTVRETVTKQVLKGAEIQDEKAFQEGNIFYYCIVLQISKESMEEIIETAFTKEEFNIERDTHNKMLEAVKDFIE